MPVHAPLQTRYGQSHDAVAQRGHLLHLHLALGAHEENLDPVAEPPFQRFRNSHGRIDMSARSAARKDDFPCHAILSFLLTINIFQPASDCPKIRRPVNPKARRSRQLKGPTAAPPRRPGPKPRQPANPAARQSEGRPRRSGNPAILRPGDLKTGVQTSAPDNIPRQAACKITNSFRSPPFRPPFTAPSFPGPASGS